MQTPAAQIGDEISVAPCIIDVRCLRRVSAQIRRIPARQRIPGQERGVVLVIERVLLSEHAVRRVACAAMCEPLHQIRAAIPFDALSRIGLIRRMVVRIPTIPHCHQRADVERKPEFRCAVCLRDRFDALHEIAIQRVHIGIVDFCVRRIGHRRVQAAAVFGDALTQRQGEVVIAIAANTGRYVRCDVG